MTTDSTLYLDSLEGWFYIAQVDNGPLFELGYFDVDDYADEHGITRVHNLETGEIND